MSINIKYTPTQDTYLFGEIWVCDHPVEALEYKIIIKQQPNYYTGDVDEWPFTQPHCTACGEDVEVF